MGENFGARDPTAGEIASNFGEKVLGNFNTEHIIKPPDAIGNHVGLKSRKCQDVSSLSLLDENIRDRYRQQVPGWRVHSNSQGVQAIRQEWTARDKDSAQQLVNHIRSVGESEGHAVSHLDVVGESLVVAELSTPALGGLTENDFIVAAKVNDLDLSDLLQKRKARFWA
eukprot:jgi/Chrzof1/11291/Cz05g31090.t1